MRARLKETEVFEEDAVEICARKVASISGDIRRALQIALRAAEICARGSRLVHGKRRRLDDGAGTKVGVRHIQMAHKELNSTPMLLAIKHASKALDFLENIKIALVFH